MRIIDLREQDVKNMTQAEVEELLPRAKFDLTSGVEAVRPMLADVRERGDEALYEFAQKFDDVLQDPTRGGLGVKVPVEELKKAYDELDSDVRDGLVEAKKRITKVHTEQLPAGHISTLDTDVEGAVATVEQRWIPARRVGLYVPGGLAVYPSSVLMNAIPAVAAGVGSIVVASPPQKAFGGLPHPTILAACYLLGIEEVVAIGGAGAIGALAYGTQSVEKVDVITGPGNIWVASAKMLVQGEVGIDAVAGPTEIMVLADKTANPEYVAADLIGQAEHDPLAGSVLVTDSADLINQVELALPARVDVTMSSARVEEALGGQQSALMLVNCQADAIRIANAYGAEHLEIHTADPGSTALNITNAGAIFLGDFSPVSLGDYIGGSNHVLPTGGSSKFSSGLSVYAFLRSVQQIHYNRPALEEVSDKIYALSRNELLPAHGEAVSARFE
jgi:histidinol dehydrogenase